MNFLTNKYGQEVDQWNPLSVNDVSVSYDKIPVTGETVTFVTGAAGFTQSVSLDKAPVMNLLGDRVGSFWRLPKNLRATNINRMGTCKVTALTETATAADVTILDPDYNLEQLFETPSGTAGFVIVVRDDTGGELYGYIKGVSASGDSYTFSVYNTAAMATQSWVGTLSSFALSVGSTQFEIYSNESSLSWTTGTILTKEVPLPDHAAFDPQALTQWFDSLSNGDYGVDYEHGIIHYKKATTGTSDTLAYTTRASTSVTVATSGVTSTLVDDSAFGVATSAVSPVGFLADEASTDSVDEGDVGAARMTLTRKQIHASEFLEDTAHTNGDYGTHILAVRKDVATALAGSDGDYSPLQVNASGNLRVTDASSGGSAGGGNNTYSTEQGDFTATVTNATTNIVLSVDSVGGSSLTAANFANAILKVWDASTDEMKRITMDDFTWTSATKTLALANCTGVFTFATADVVSLTITGPDKMRDSATDSQKASLIRDVSDQYVNETLIDTTNVGAATNYYPSSAGLAMDGYSGLSIQAQISGGVTATIEVTNDDASSPDWVDITDSCYNWTTAGTRYSASWVDTNFLFMLENLNVKAVRIKSITSDATNSVQYNVRRIY